MDKIGQLHTILSSLSAIHHSRIHRLRTFSSDEYHCYIKREDELGFGITGSKLRKYSTLIPYLIKEEIEEVIVIGSAFSNHVLGIVQLLIENGIRSTLFLKGRQEHAQEGNALLIQLLIDSGKIRWFSSQEWKNIDQTVLEYIESCSHPVYVLEEGGSVSHAFPGILSLPLDIVVNEQEKDVQFDHIFVDCGTGLTACATILGMHWIEKKSIIHVLLLSGSEEDFLKQLRRWHREFEKLLGIEISFPSRFVLHRPEHHASFGSTGKEVFQTIADIARGEGFLTDPIYTAKLFLEVKKQIGAGHLKGNVLVNHSGGAISLNGFQEQLRNVIS